MQLHLLNAVLTVGRLTERVDYKKEEIYENFRIYFK